MVRLVLWTYRYGGTNKFLAVPHAEVPTTEFYKHIAIEMPEPRRMRQLLLWCGSRALRERPTGPAKDLSALLAGSLT